MQTGFAISNATPSRRGISAGETSSDISLIEDISLGDKRAMQVLFARHNVRVYRFILRMIGNEAVAEELVSEVFLEVWRQADGFEGRSQVSTWLLGIARFKALTSLRQRKEEELEDGAAEAIEDHADTPEMAMAKNETGSILRQCLMRLSSAHREVIDLAYYHEKSTQEAARIIGIPESTVKTRMFYARQRLAELLKEAGVSGALS